MRIKVLRDGSSRRQHQFPSVIASAIDGARSASSSPTPPLPGSAPRGFSAPEASQFRLAVLGDLHYDPRDEEAFTKAREQLARVLKEKAEEEGDETPSAVVASRLVQLGDLGASSFAPGTPACFERAREFLGTAAAEEESFGSAPALVAGNHGKFSDLFFVFSLSSCFIPYVQLVS